MFTMKNVDKARKLRFLFDIYDMDGDGLISNSELYTVGEQRRIEVFLDLRFFGLKCMTIGRETSLNFKPTKHDLHKCFCTAFTIRANQKKA